MKAYRPIAGLALAGLLLWVVALGATPAHTVTARQHMQPAHRVELLPHTISTPAFAKALGPSSPEEMEAFLDAFFAAKMAELQIPGAAIVVVRDGELVLSPSCSPGLRRCRQPNEGSSIWMPMSTPT